ncbi:MAG TPA: zf-HC2 domain-containing protein, partial [Terriglobia bacterium]|nr:zf-HC2 domain-containing protein [Terriglobia bacterium]
MSCGFSKEWLSLHVEGDLSDSQERITARHLRECGACRRFFDDLQETQARMKQLRCEMPAESALAEARHQVMSKIDATRRWWDWGVSFERWILLGLRGRRYTFAGLAVAVIMSSALLPQIRPFAPAVPAGFARFD